MRGAGFWSLVLVVCAARCGCADLILAYESTNAVLGLAATEVATGVTALELTRGPGLARAAGGTLNSRGWTSDSTVDADDYLEWGWSAATSAWDLARLELRYDRSSTGPSQLEIQLAVNGGGFSTIFTDAAVSTSGEDQLAIDLSAVQNVQMATFRLFAFDASSSSGTLDLENFQSNPNRAVAVHGAATNAVPEPATWLMMALGMLGAHASIIARRAFRATPLGFRT